MGKISIRRLRRKKIGIDTNIFIYQFESSKKWSKITNEIFQLAEQDYSSLFTSVITVAEVLHLPKAKRDLSLEAAYSLVFQLFPNLHILDLGFESGVIAAELIAKYKIRLPDAFQLATCITQKCDYFVTNDVALSKVKEIKVIQLTEFVDHST